MPHPDGGMTAALADQLRRQVSSVALNIGEGAYSNATQELPTLQTSGLADNRVQHQRAVMRLVAIGFAFAVAVFPNPASARDPDCPDCPLGDYDAARAKEAGRVGAELLRRQPEEHQGALDRTIALLMDPEGLPWDEQPNAAIAVLQVLGLTECAAADPTLLAPGKAGAPEAAKGSAVKCRLGNVTWAVRYRWTGDSPASAHLQDHVLGFAASDDCRRVQATLGRSPFTAAPQSGPESRARVFRARDRERVLLVRPQCSASRLTLTSWLNDNQ